MSHTTKVSTSTVIELCNMRQQYFLPCKDCKFYGKYCENIKHKFKVKKPYELRRGDYYD